MNKKSVYVKELVKKINDTGWVAFYHPRRHTVTISGGKELKENIAIREMERMLNKTTVD